MLSIRISADGATPTIHLAGILDVNEVARAATELAAAIDSARSPGPLVLDASEVLEVDLAGVQLLWWARKTAGQRGVTVQLEPGEAVASALDALAVDWGTA